MLDYNAATVFAARFDDEVTSDSLFIRNSSTAHAGEVELQKLFYTKLAGPTTSGETLASILLRGVAPAHHITLLEE
eukprot:2715288-Prymnesium_polylepis.1